MDGSDSARHALNDLEASLKRVLLHTGSALITSSGNGGMQIEASRRNLQKTLPEALTQWYDGIGILEKQLATSKAILHRDLARMRSAKRAEQEPRKVSPASSAESDIVMVEAPSKDQTVTNGAPAVGQAVAQASSSDAAKDTPLSQDGPLDTYIQITQQQQHDGETQDPVTPSEQQTSEDKTNSMEPHMTSTGAAQEVAPKSRADSPVPTVETAQAVRNDQANDPTNDFANADVGSLLPGLMDYANGVNETSDEGINLNELTGDNLFGSGQDNELQGAVGEAGDGSNDLFGDASLTADGATGNLDDQDTAFDLSNMNFDLANGSFATDAGQGMNVDYDLLGFDQEFFNV